jgi:hypothetical protein
LDRYDSKYEDKKAKEVDMIIGDITFSESDIGVKENGNIE